MNKFKNVVVFLGGFQEAELSEYNWHVINNALTGDYDIQPENIVIGITISKSYDTKRFPLPYFVRAKTIKDKFPTVNIIPIIEVLTSTGEIDSSTMEKNTRNIVSKMYPDCEIIDIITFENNQPVLSRKTTVNDSFRDGMIYQALSQRDKATIAVDIVPFHDGKVLLGRKPGESQYRFIGGHVDTTDDSLEMSALRELAEETGISYTNLDIEDNITYALNRLKFLGTKRVEDPRYSKDSNRIFTVFYKLEMLKSDGIILGYAKPGDDIEEIKWFTRDELLELTLKKQIRFEHQPLLAMLLENWKENWK